MSTWIFTLALFCAWGTVHVYTSGNRAWRLLDPDSSVARISKLREYIQCTCNTHLLGELGHAPAMKLLHYEIFFVRYFWPQIPFVHSYLYTSSMSTWNQSHMLITTLAFHIISTRAPVNLTWAQARVCPGVAMALDPEAGIKRLRSHQPLLIWPSWCTTSV